MEPSSLTGTLLGPYRVESVIGRSGMGEVYRPHDTTLGRQVALKVIHGGIGTPDRLARFVQEARSASALNHPNVVSIHWIGREKPTRDGAPAADGEVTFIAMELVTGDTLRALVESRRLDLKRALDYLAQAAEALAAVHATGIVHRDLKPDNVVVIAPAAHNAWILMQLKRPD